MIIKSNICSDSTDTILLYTISGIQVLIFVMFMV